MSLFGEVCEPAYRCFYDCEVPQKIVNLPQKLNFDKIKELVVIESVFFKQIVNQTSFKSLDPTFQSDNFILYSIEDKIICFSYENYAQFPNLASDCKVKMLSIQHLSNFKAQYDRNISMIVRKLSTDKDMMHDNIVTLETPNFITGFAANLGSKLKMNNHPFTCYISYINEFDAIAMKNILKLLKERLNVIDDDKLKSECVFNNNSNMYI